MDIVKETLADRIRNTIITSIKKDASLPNVLNSRIEVTAAHQLVLQLKVTSHTGPPFGPRYFSVKLSEHY